MSSSDPKIFPDSWNQPQTMNSKTQSFKQLFKEQCTETVVQVINYMTTKCKEMDIYTEEGINFGRIVGEATKDAAVTGRNQKGNVYFNAWL